MSTRAGRPTVIPLFPLGTVLVPHLVLPLHIFEPRYRTLIANLTEREPADQEFGVIAIRDGQQAGADAAHGLHEIGTTAMLQSVTLLEDGRFDIITVGHRRFRLLDVDDSLPYLQAQVDFIDEPVGDCPEELLADVAVSYADYRGLFDPSQTAEEIEDDLPDEPVVLSYLIASALAIATPRQQELLEIADAGARLRAELTVLRQERTLMRVLPSLPLFDVDRSPSPN